MGIMDVLAYCKQNMIPITAVKSEPFFDTKKQRVSKGVGKTYADWNKKKRYEHNKTILTPFDDTLASMWMMYLRSANMFVIDIDVKGTDTIEDVLVEGVYDKLVESSDYVVRTGSGGMHFYYAIPTDLPEGSKLIDKTKVEALQKCWIKPDSTAEIDILVDKVIVEGSSYTFKDKTYTYTAVKEKSNISKVSFHKGLWEECSKYILRTPADKEKEINDALNRGIETTELEEHLANIPNTQANWDEWYKMGQTLYNILGSDGIEVFRKWSKKCPSHDDSELDKLWKGLTKRTDGNSRTIGSILFMSKTSNEETYNAIRSKYHQLSYGAMKSLIEQDHFFVEEPKPRYVRQCTRRLIEYTPTEFKDLLTDWTFFIPQDDKEPIEASFYTIWTKDSNKRKYKKIDFYPNAEECPKNVFNSFIPCEASFLPPVAENSVDLSKIFHHIDIMSGNNKDGSEFILNFLAQIVQYPHILIGISIVLFAEQGAGKDIFMDLFGEHILGEHLYYKLGNASNLFKSFNADLVGKTLVHCDEINIGIMEKHNDDMKRIITNGRIRIEQKGKDAFSSKSYSRLFMTTNNRDALKIDSSDRRMVVFRSSNKYLKNTKYFNQFAEEFKKPTVQRAFYDFLMKRDISKFDHNVRPITAIYKEMKEASIDSFLLFIRDNDTAFTPDEPLKLKTTDWMKMYNDWALANNMEFLNVKTFGVRMNEFCEKNIGFVKSFPKNVSHTSIHRESVIAYIQKEIS